jgi:hypothetical protein
LIRKAPGFDGIRLLFPSGPVKYEAGQLLRLLLEHCGAAVCEDVTTAVGVDETSAEPAEFDAVTNVRIVKPTSAATSTYDDPVAPTKTQLPPDELHRHHW